MKMSKPLFPLASRLPEKEIEHEPEGPEAMTALELLQLVYRDRSQPMTRRMRAAVAALNYEVPKLAVIAAMDPEGFAKRLEEVMEKIGMRTVIDATPQTGDTE
jgi:hypothetical protein